MKAIVDPELCIACGACEEVCPEVFILEDDLAEVKHDPVPLEFEEACREAMEVCPVEAISLKEE